MIVQRPTYVDGAAPSPQVAQACGKGASVLLAAAFGAVAAYYVPKLLDRFGPSFPDPEHGNEVTLDIADG